MVSGLERLTNNAHKCTAFSDKVSIEVVYKANKRAFVYAKGTTAEGIVTHFTVDKVFAQYLRVRKEEPKRVEIFDTVKALTTTLKIII